MKLEQDTIFTLELEDKRIEKNLEEQEQN